VAAAFTIAVSDRFPEDPTLETVRDYVRDVRARTASADRAPHYVAEGLIRGVVGEEELLAEMPADQVLATETWLTYMLVKDAHPDDEGRRQYVEEAVKTANEWLTAVTGTDGPPDHR